MNMATTTTTQDRFHRAFVLMCGEYNNAQIQTTSVAGYRRRLSCYPLEVQEQAMELGPLLYPERLPNAPELWHMASAIQAYGYHATGKAIEGWASSKGDSKFRPTPPQFRAMVRDASSKRPIPPSEHQVLEANCPRTPEQRADDERRGRAFIAQIHDVLGITAADIGKDMP